MIKRVDEIYNEEREDVRGGEGTAVFSHFLSGEELPPNYRLVSTIMLDYEASIGLHTHENETEVYHILEGFAEYNDNGKIYTIEEGDTTVVYNGQSHAIKNIGDEKLVFLAIIVLT